MSIEDTEVVDAIGVDRETGKAVLTISDHLDWKESNGQHLSLMQEKLNTYLRFIESGEIYESYPDARNRSLVINVVGKYALNRAASEFFASAKSIVEGAGFELTFELFAESGSCH